ncbi:MAG: hypothetical protein AAGG80_03370, partial [Pseudomonadota bacterium]
YGIDKDWENTNIPLEKIQQLIEPKPQEGSEALVEKVQEVQGVQQKPDIGSIEEESESATLYSKEKNQEYLLFGNKEKPKFEEDDSEMNYFQMAGKQYVQSSASSP